jgi:ParB-like chromosome segregation protein Spo0J
MESIKKYGYCQPILVDTSYVIIAGHTRYKALIEMGWKEVQCLILNLTEKKAKQCRIIDNKTSEFSKLVSKDLGSELREFDNLEKEFQVFFKEDLEALMEDTLGKKLADANKKDVEKTQDKLDNKYVELSRKDQIEIACPHCTETFFVDRKDIVSIE